MRQDHQVLVVGAGPTGLAMAIELMRAQIPVRIINKSERPARYSQALVVQARTLEQFERYGIANQAVARGRKLQRAVLATESGGAPAHRPMSSERPRAGGGTSVAVGGARKIASSESTGTQLTTARLTPEIADLFGSRNRIAVVRPDGYLGFRGSLDDLARLDDYAHLTGFA